MEHSSIECFLTDIAWIPAWAEGQVEIRYSKNLKVEYRDKLTLVTVSNPWPGANTGFHYLLKPRGAKTPAAYANYQIVEIPIQGMVALSSTYLAFIEQLGLTDKLLGLSDLSRVLFRKVYVKPLSQGRSKRLARAQTFWWNPSLI